MRLLPIKLIISEMQNELPDAWKKYKGYLSDVSRTKRIDLDPCISEQGVLQSGKISPLNFAHLNKDALGKWGERFKKIDGFEEIERKFTEKITKYARFCPYCGKIPLIHYSNKAKERRRTYHLDHFFPKSKYPHLTFNFYNLVPSCSICNQMKRTKNPANIVVGGRIYHPYFGWFDQQGTISPNKDFSNGSIMFWGSSDFSNDFKSHSEFFKLGDIYQNAWDSSIDMRYMRDLRNQIRHRKARMESIGVPFDGEKIKKEFFWNYAPDSDLDVLNYPNGKLRLDTKRRMKF